MGPNLTDFLIKKKNLDTNIHTAEQYLNTEAEVGVMPEITKKAPEVGGRQGADTLSEPQAKPALLYIPLI